jgi:hypothetical protein
MFPPQPLLTMLGNSRNKNSGLSSGLNHPSKYLTRTNPESAPKQQEAAADYNNRPRLFTRA